MLGIAQHQSRNYAAAVATLQSAIDLRPDDPLLFNNLGSALRANGDLPGALAAFRRATELAPDLAAAWFNLGKTLRTHSYIAEAKQALERALECDPSHAAARASLGDVLKTFGETESAATLFRSTLGDKREAARAWFKLANLKTIPFSAEDTRRLRMLFDDSSLSVDERIHAGFALSKALEDQSDYASAFAVLSEANRLKRATLVWDGGAYTKRVEAIAHAFATPLATESEDALGSEAIFVICLPRSGSTLTEQILSSHPEVEGANELHDLGDVLREESARRELPFPEWVPSATPADWRRMGLEYLRRTERWRQSRPRSTDKGLTNWMYVGAAAAMLPGARFVNCRRDPVETCLGGFRQLFSRGNEYTYNLDELAIHWHGYDRLSRLWQAIYPERVHELIYETLVADPEKRIRELLAFLGLPFDPACINFHRSERNVRTASAAQVRQPLRGDTARANRYGNAIDALRRALQT